MHREYHRIAEFVASRGRIACRAPWCCSEGSPALESPRCCCRSRPRRAQCGAGALQLGRGVGASDQASWRAHRSGRAPLYLLAETCLARILEEIERLKRRSSSSNPFNDFFARFQSRPAAYGRCARSHPPAVCGEGPKCSDRSGRHVTKTATWPARRRWSCRRYRAYFEGTASRPSRRPCI